MRESHGILAELVLEPTTSEGDTVVVTVWPSHEMFDAWIATPERDALTASVVHRSVECHPITRYELVEVDVDHQSGQAANSRRERQSPCGSKNPRTRRFSAIFEPTAYSVRMIAESV